MPSSVSAASVNLISTKQYPTRLPRGISFQMGAMDFTPTCPPRYQFWMLVRRMSVGILTTRSARGVLTSRQLVTCNSKNDVGQTLRFFVSVDCLWIRDIAVDDHVSVVYADPHREQFLAVSGKAKVRHCPKLQQALWNGAAMRSFPGGPADPLLRMLEVQIESVSLQNGEDDHELSSDDFTHPPRQDSRLQEEVVACARQAGALETAGLSQAR